MGGLVSVEVPEPASAEELARREHDRLVRQSSISVGALFDDMSPAEQAGLTALYADRVARLGVLIAGVVPHISTS